jgi:hypothetical protein
MRNATRVSRSPHEFFRARICKKALVESVYAAMQRVVDVGLTDPARRHLAPHPRQGGGAGVESRSAC